MVVGINLTPGRVIFLLSQNETVVRQLYNSTNNRPSVSITVIVITLSCLELYIMLRHIVRTTFHRQRERASSALLFQLDNLVHNTSSRSDINFIEKRTEWHCRRKKKETDGRKKSRYSRPVKVIPDRQAMNYEFSRKSRLGYRKHPGTSWSFNHTSDPGKILDRDCSHIIISAIVDRQIKDTTAKREQSDLHVQLSDSFACAQNKLLIFHLNVKTLITVP